VTIPNEIRERGGLLLETEAEFRFDGEVVSFVRAHAAKEPTCGARLAAHLKEKGALSK
jgi:hypothetical protein